MSFRANAVSRGIHASCRFYLVLVHYPTWWIPPLRCRYGRNDRRFWFGCYKCKRTTVPALRAGWRQVAAATPVTYNGIRNVAAMIHRHSSPGEGLAPLQIELAWLNGTTPRHVIPSERSESRNLLKWQILSCVGSSSHVVDSSTPLALRSE